MTVVGLGDFMAAPNRGIAPAMIYLATREENSAQADNYADAGMGGALAETLKCRPE